MSDTDLEDRPTSMLPGAPSRSGAAPHEPLPAHAHVEVLVPFDDDVKMMPEVEVEHVESMDEDEEETVARPAWSDAPGAPDGGVALAVASRPEIPVAPRPVLPTARNLPTAAPFPTAKVTAPPAAKPAAWPMAPRRRALGAAGSGMAGKMGGPARDSPLSRLELALENLDVEPGEILGSKPHPDPARSIKVDVQRRSDERKAARVSGLAARVDSRLDAEAALSGVPTPTPASTRDLVMGEPNPWAEELDDDDFVPTSVMRDDDEDGQRIAEMLTAIQLDPQEWRMADSDRSAEIVPTASRAESSRRNPSGLGVAPSLSLESSSSSESDSITVESSELESSGLDSTGHESPGRRSNGVESSRLESSRLESSPVNSIASSELESIPVEAIAVSSDPESVSPESVALASISADASVGHSRTANQPTLDRELDASSDLEPSGRVRGSTVPPVGIAPDFLIPRPSRTPVEAEVAPIKQGTPPSARETETWRERIAQLEIQVSATRSVAQRSNQDLVAMRSEMKRELDRIDFTSARARAAAEQAESLARDAVSRAEESEPILELQKRMNDIDFLAQHVRASLTSLRQDLSENQRRDEARASRMVSFDERVTKLENDPKSESVNLAVERAEGRLRIIEREQAAIRGQLDSLAERTKKLEETAEITQERTAVILAWLEDASASR